MRLITFLLACIIGIFSFAQSNSKIVDKTKNMQKFEGYFNFWWDASSGKIWLQIDKFDLEFLYVNSLPAGLGSNDSG